MFVVSICWMFVVSICCCMKFKLITIQATRFFISSFTCSPPVCGNVYVNKDTSMLRYRLWVVFWRTPFRGFNSFKNNYLLVDSLMMGKYFYFYLLVRFVHVICNGVIMMNWIWVVQDLLWTLHSTCNLKLKNSGYREFSVFPSGVVLYPVKAPVGNHALPICPKPPEHHTTPPPTYPKSIN
ncbi:hypothetical protein Hanom_Chr12g01148531 [Helianthus anomalus]